MTQFPITRKDLKNLPASFRIEAIVADGMWYSLPKWRKFAKVTEEEIQSWVDEKLASGKLLQSPTGAKSYRYPYEEVCNWHEANGLAVGEQIFDFIFPARVWDGKTEVEGFLEAPLREIGVVTFECSAPVAKEITERLRGIARVRESDPGRYKAYCLTADYVRPIISEVFSKYTVAEASRIYSRGNSKRRELADFSERFAHHLVSFYKNFAKALVKKEMETIKIYIPDPHDQESQIVSWVLTAIEKFDESSSVPFSGYLNSVLRRWPYDLPNHHLGKDLSVFQRNRSKAVASLREKTGDPTGQFTAAELADEMGMTLSSFIDLEEKHHIWMKTKNATSLVWDENSEEKGGEQVLGALGDSSARKSNIAQANNLSKAIVAAALDTGQYADAFKVISQMGTEDLDQARLQSCTPAFILSLGNFLGME